MWKVFASLGFIMACAGAIMIGVGKKQNLDEERYIIGGSIILAFGVSLAIGGLISYKYPLPWWAATLCLIFLAGTCVGTGFAAIANKRMKEVSENSDDYKNYKSKWLTGGIVGAVISGLLLLITLYFGVENSNSSVSNTDLKYESV